MKNNKIFNIGLSTNNTSAVNRKYVNDALNKKIGLKQRHQHGWE